MMDKSVIEEIKRKKEFSELPDSIVERAADISKGDVKESRALLRKYFGVFLTNKVLRGKGSAEEILKAHISSKKRDYSNFYREVFDGVGEVGCVVDLGAGVNGFSYGYLKDEIGSVDYVGVEGAGQEVNHMNKYFEENGFDMAHAAREDLFNVGKITGILKKQKKPRIVFLFQVIDALENLKRDFSKEFILEISRHCEIIVVSLPTESLGGRKKFMVMRKWFVDFLLDNFVIDKDITSNGERIIRFHK